MGYREISDSEGYFWGYVENFLGVFCSLTPKYAKRRSNPFAYSLTDGRRLYVIVTPAGYEPAAIFKASKTPSS